ncbi:MAG: SDR family oxidoreductase [Beutenbergiaceae bacterium]
MSHSQDQRSVVVTGAAQGIGRGIAQRLGADGLALTVVDLESSADGLVETARLIEAVGGVVRTAFADVSSASQVDAAVDAHVAAYGGIDVMVANAGMAVTARFVDTTPDDFERSFAVNTCGVANCYLTATRHMIDRGRGGKLIAAGSVSAHRGGAWQAAYAASKFAVRGLTQAVATELAEYGITANLYSPGVVQTPMWDALDEVVTSQEGTPPGSQFAKVLPEIKLGRYAQPADVAGVVSFLASTDSDYMTGQSIIVDGGILFV